MTVAVNACVRERHVIVALGCCNNRGFSWHDACFEREPLLLTRHHAMTGILVVDDDEAVRSAFGLALEPPAFELRTAAAADEALAMLAQSGADLIFLDLNMPHCNGVELLRHIRRTDRVTPVFIVTAFAEEFMPALRKAAVDGLHFNLLRKPLDIEEIHAAARAALAGTLGKEEEVDETCST